ncbi:YeiH family protein [Pseudooceanicola nitratireducens]|uniref:YeiH family protein n=1 Tax=Pseudooceanicola nitratireducens TaxID=517719 RepID=UPI0031045CFC
MTRLRAWIHATAPGLGVVAMIVLAAQFVSDHYGAPAMLMALLFGIALHFLSEEPRPRPGIDLAASTVLRLGVALLGLRISADLALSLGWPVLVLAIAGVVATILFGIALGRTLGHGDKFAFLSGGAVAICGASAAMAIAAILPRDEKSEERLVFTVVGITILSTFAMITYPILAEALGLSQTATAIFLGATIHDVAQVVGAGFSVSPETGEIAAVVKLIRVAMLAPVIILATLALRRSAPAETGSRPPLVPAFVLGFFGLLVVNSLGLVPSVISDIAAHLSRWFLLAAIAAVGLKTSLRDVLKVGSGAIALLVAETVFLAVFVLAGLSLLSL